MEEDGIVVVARIIVDDGGGGLVGRGGCDVGRSGDKCPLSSNPMARPEYWTLPMELGGRNLTDTRWWLITHRTTDL